MPIFHMQIAEKTVDYNGESIPLPPRLALQRRGPVIQVTVSLEQGMVQALVQQGSPVPGNVTGFALIDTGASISCIDEKAAQDLGLPVIDVCQMMSASHSAHPSNVYPISIVIGPGVAFSAPRAMGASLAVQGLIAIIGRDILSVCTLFYNGSTGQITLSL